MQRFVAPTHPVGEDVALLALAPEDVDVDAERHPLERAPGVAPAQLLGAFAHEHEARVHPLRDRERTDLGDRRLPGVDHHRAALGQRTGERCDRDRGLGPRAHLHPEERVGLAQLADGAAPVGGDATRRVGEARPSDRRRARSAVRGRAGAGRSSGSTSSDAGSTARRVARGVRPPQVKRVTIPESPPPWVVASAKLGCAACGSSPFPCVCPEPRAPWWWRRGSGELRGPAYVCMAGTTGGTAAHAHSELQLLRRVARNRPVLFVNSIGLRMPVPGRSTQPWRRVARKARERPALPAAGRSPTPPDFIVLSPVVLPLYGTPRRSGRRQPRSCRAQLRASVAGSSGSDEPIVVVTLPTGYEVVRAAPPHGRWSSTRRTSSPSCTTSTRPTSPSSSRSCCRRPTGSCTSARR